jgi:hypothetical protein
MIAELPSGAAEGRTSKANENPLSFERGNGAEGVFEWAGVGGAHPALLIIGRSEREM